MGGDSIFSLTGTFSRVMCVSTRTGISSAPSIEQSVMVSSSGRDHDRGRDFGGSSLFGGGRGSYNGRQQTVDDKGPRQCKH